jgi:hypothetical protein
LSLPEVTKGTKALMQEFCPFNFSFVTIYSRVHKCRKPAVCRLLSLMSLLSPGF